MKSVKEVEEYLRVCADVCSNFEDEDYQLLMDFINAQQNKIDLLMKIKDKTKD